MSTRVGMGVINTGSASSVGYRNWLGQNGQVAAAVYSSDGKSSSWPNLGTEPPNDVYWAEKGPTHLAVSGNPMASSEDYGKALDLGFSQTIGNHHYMTGYAGYVGNTNPGDYNYCPIYGNVIVGIRFRWKKYCAGNESKSKHRFRMIKLGGAFRNTNGSRRLVDFTRDTSDLFKFKAGTQRGSASLTLRNSTDAGHLQGIYFQVETEGGGTGSVGGSHIRIYDMDVRLRNGQIILPARKVYTSMDPPSGNSRQIFTYPA